MGKIDTLIGKTAHLRGDLTFSGALHLEGRISGNVRAEPSAGSTLSLSECGCIEGAVDAVNVILDGVVTGPIRARGRLVLGPAARIYGDVHYGIIEMTPGAEILGRLVRLNATDPGAAGTAAKVEARLSEAF